MKLLRECDWLPCPATILSFLTTEPRLRLRQKQYSPFQNLSQLNVALLPRMRQWNHSDSHRVVFIIRESNSFGLCISLPIWNMHTVEYHTEEMTGREDGKGPCPQERPPAAHVLWTPPSAAPHSSEFACAVPTCLTNVTTFQCLFYVQLDINATDRL